MTGLPRTPPHLVARLDQDMCEAQAAVDTAVKLYRDSLEIWEGDDTAALATLFQLVAGLSPGACQSVAVAAVLRLVRHEDAGHHL